MRRALLLFLAAGVSACIVSTGGGGDVTPSPSPSGTATPTLTPTPTASPSPSPTPTPPQLRVELSWPSQYMMADLDLHFVFKSHGGTIFNAAFDCFYANCRHGAGENLDWGVVGTDGNPSLLQDNISVAVPEITVMTAPSNGVYSVCAYFFGDHGASSAAAHAEVFVDTALQFSADHTFSLNQSWYVGDITWADGVASVTGVDTVANVIADSPGTQVCGP